MNSESWSSFFYLRLLIKKINQTSKKGCRDHLVNLDPREIFKIKLTSSSMILYRSFSSRMSRTRVDLSYWHVGRVLPGLAAHRGVHSQILGGTCTRINGYQHRDWHSRMPYIRPHQPNACVCALSGMAVCVLESGWISEGRMMQQLQVNVIRDWSNGKRAEPSNCPSR